MPKVVIGVDPHKASNTVIDLLERVVAQQRFANRPGTETWGSAPQFKTADDQLVANAWVVELAEGTRHLLYEFAQQYRLGYFGQSPPNPQQRRLGESSALRCRFRALPPPGLDEPHGHRQHKEGADDRLVVRPFFMSSRLYVAGDILLIIPVSLSEIRHQLQPLVLPQPSHT